MLDAAVPGSPVFIAPDGRVYVDRDGTSDTTPARWRAAFDPATVRRRQRWSALLPVLALVVFTTVGAFAGVGVVAIAAAAQDTPIGLDAVVIGAVIGALAGPASTFVVVLRKPGNPVQTTIAPVPDEVIDAAPADAAAADVWRWSTVVEREAAQRRTIGYETYVERPFMQARAEVSAARYDADYRAYVAVAAELGFAPRPPAVDLADPLHS